MAFYWSSEENIRYLFSPLLWLRPEGFGIPVPYYAFWWHLKHFHYLTWDLHFCSTDTPHTHCIYFRLKRKHIHHLFVEEMMTTFTIRMLPFCRTDIPVSNIQIEILFLLVIWQSGDFTIRQSSNHELFYLFLCFGEFVSGSSMVGGRWYCPII